MADELAIDLRGGEYHHSQYVASMELGRRFTLEDMIVKQLHGPPTGIDWMAFVMQHGPKHQDIIAQEVETCMALESMYEQGMIKIRGDMVEPI